MTTSHTAAVVERVRTEISKLRAAEVGGCFRPPAVEQGECADGDCYCSRQCEREAIAALDASGHAEMVAALEALLEDERFPVAVGGDHIAVDAMLTSARAALAKGRGEEPSR